MLGGFGAMKDATADIKDIANGMKERVEEALGETYTEFEAVKYTEQVVNGTNYNIKVKVGGDKYIHMKVHVPLPYKNEPNKLMEQSKGKTLADPL